MRIKALFATRASYTWTCLAVALGTMLVYAVRKGQDASWDQLNYHLDIPFLLLHGTYWDSIAPSGIQTYLNPLILIPQYLVIRALPPLAAVATIVLAQSMAFVIAARICLRIAGPDPAEGGYFVAFLGFVLCLASPMALSEAGTTIVDLTDAIPVLLAYLLLLTRDDASAPRHACLAAGLLLGLSAGLKLTNMTFVIGAPAFFLAGSEPPRCRVVDMMQLMLGAAISFAGIAGWWHIALWRRFHNPIFPYANNIFRSPDYPMVAQRDVRFLPTSAWDIVLYPYHWLVGTTLSPVLRSVGSETDPKDARFALALAGVPVALAMVLFRRPRGRALLARPETGLLLACAIDYLVWLFTFGILRYLIPVEILCGAVLLVLTGWVAAGRWRTRFLLLLAIAVVVRMHVASWQRVAWQSHWATIAETPLALHGKPLVFLTFAPSAFVALSLPANARYVNLDCGQMNLCGRNETSLTRQLRGALAAVPPDTLYAVIPSTSARPLDAPATPNISGLGTYGLRLGTECQPLAVAGKVYLVCEVLRAPSRP
jgi:hypothetical protein